MLVWFVRLNIDLLAAEFYPRIWEKVESLERGRTSEGVKKGPYADGRGMSGGEEDVGELGELRNSCDEFVVAGETVERETRQIDEVSDIYPSDRLFVVLVQFNGERCEMGGIDGGE